MNDSPFYEEMRMTLECLRRALDAEQEQAQEIASAIADIKVRVDNIGAKLQYLDYLLEDAITAKEGK